MGVPCFLILQANVSFRTSLGSIRATVVSDPSNYVGTIDPVPVKYRRNHRLKAELT